MRELLGKQVERRSLLRAVLGGGLLTVACGTGGERADQDLAQPDSPSPEEGVDFSKGMHAVITGSGSALPDPQRGNASQAVVVDGQVLQFDCGSRALGNLMQAGINPLDIDHIFFTHLHFDHIATYDYFVITTWLAGRAEPVQVYGPEGTEAMSEGAIHGMHAMDFGYVSRLVETWPEDFPQKPAPSPPFQVTDISEATIDAEAGLVVEADSFRVRAAFTPHITDWGFKSLGYRVDSDYGSVAISGDTAPSQAMIELSRGVDILIHECVIPDYGMTVGGKFSTQGGVQREERGREDRQRPRTGHTSPSQLGKLAQAAGVKKVVATHLPPYTSVQAAVDMSSLYYGPRQSPDIWDKYKKGIEAEFDGEVVLAEDAMVLSI